MSDALKLRELLQLARPAQVKAFKALRQEDRIGYDRILALLLRRWMDG